VAQEALAEMRALLYELHPTALAEEGLTKALEKLVASMQVRVEVPITFAGGTARRLAADTETAIFRIAQEALSNAAKYARAGAIRVHLAEVDGKTVVTVADDGVGFDPDAVVTPSTDGQRGGMGLRSMRARAAAAGLVLRVESAPRAGSRVTVEAPLP
jgi:signal transduction histidine kinase